MKRKINKIGYLSVSVILAFSCFYIVQSVILPTMVEKEYLTLSTTRLQPFGLLYIAREKGYFKDENLEVNFREFNLSADALDDVVNGGSDLATVFDSVYVKKVQEGEDLSIVSSLHRSKNNAAIVGFKKNGIENVEDLKSKKIGVVKNTSSELLAYTILKSYKINLTDVEFVFIQPTDIETELETGNVQSVLASNISLYNITKKYNEQDMTYIYPENFTAASVITGNTKVLQNKKEAVRRLLSALSKAEDFYLNNKNESVEIISKNIPDTPKQTIKDLWDKNVLTLDLDNVLVELLNSGSQNLNTDISSNKIIKDFREKIITEYLKEVRPSSVTLF